MFFLRASEDKNYLLWKQAGKARWWVRWTHKKYRVCILVIWLFAFGTPFLLSLWIEKNKRTDAKKSVKTMSASGDDVEDSTEYSRYGIKDAPQTAIATPLGQVSARFLQNLQGVGLSFQIWTSARDRNVIYVKTKGLYFFYCLCVHASFHYRHRLLWSRVSRLTFRISIKQLLIFMSVIKWYFSALSCLIINGLYDSGFTQLCLILNQLMYCSFGGYFFYINL